MTTTELNFMYKGQRDYVHGTDMYKEICGLAAQTEDRGESTRFKMTIHDIVRHQCDLAVVRDAYPPARPPGGKVEFSCRGQNTSLAGWLIETNRPVEGRYAYPEEEITRKARVSGQCVVMTDPSPYSPIEVLVAINKHLHTVFFPEARGKWYFTRLELDRLLRPEDSQCFRLTLIQNLNFKLTKAKIEVGQTAIGHIYFSLV